MIVVLNLFDVVKGQENQYAEYLRRVQPILDVVQDQLEEIEMSKEREDPAERLLLAILEENAQAFVRMIAEEGVQVILTCDEPCDSDLPNWYPKGRHGLRMRYYGKYS